MTSPVRPRAPHPPADVVEQLRELSPWGDVNLILRGFQFVAEGLSYRSAICTSLRSVSQFVYQRNSTRICHSLLGKYVQRYVRYYEQNERCIAAESMILRLGNQLIDMLDVFPRTLEDASKVYEVKQMRASLRVLRDEVDVAQNEGLIWVKTTLPSATGQLKHT